MGVAKAALEANVRYLAYDLGPKNIRVNAISAGAIKTLASSAVGGIKSMLKASEEMTPLQAQCGPGRSGQDRRLPGQRLGLGRHRRHPLCGRWRQHCGHELWISRNPRTYPRRAESSKFHLSLRGMSPE
jgi:hypothetical protein